jgi:hypothetical protein
MLAVSRIAGVCPEDQLTSLPELGYAGDMPDEEWMAALGAKGGDVAVTRDGNILNAAVRRSAWRSSGLGMIILDKKWGSLPRRDWARHILYWWPVMTARVLQGPAGNSFTVAPKIQEPPSTWIRIISGDGSNS